MKTINNKRRTATPKRPLSSVLTSFVVAGFSSAALGNPQNHTVVEGNTPVVTSNGTELNIATDGRTILNWDSFSIANGELTRFVMSGTDRAVLNRVTGGLLSQIDGTLEANGRVYLINPNGVIVGATGIVQTQSFIASSRDLLDADFMDGGELTFLGTGSSEVHNLGTIEATDGDVALIGKRVVSSGSISAPQGIVALAAGDEIMLAEPGSSRLLVRVDGVASGQAALIDHTGLLNAAQAELQGAGGNPYALAVNAGGQINATGIQNRDGRIYLTVDVGQINVSGTLTATNNDASGGGIHLDSGAGYGGEVLVNGTLDASSTSTGGGIHIDSSRVTLDNGAHLLVSGGSGNAGGVFIGDLQGTDYLYVAEDASIEANSLSGDAGNVDLSGAGVYFHGQLQARGAGTQATFNIHSGEALEYTGLADLRAYGDNARFGTVSIETVYANLILAANSSPSIVDADAIARQLNYANVKIAATRADRYIEVLAPIAWQSATRLTLQADGNIDINQAIEASNGALYLISLNGGVTDVEPATITVRDLWLSAANEVNLSNRVIAQNVTLYDVGGRTGLTNEQNQLDAVTFTRDLRAQSGEVDIVDSAGGLSLTTSNVGGITYATDGSFRVRTSGDLTLASAFQTQVNGDVTLVAAGGLLRNQSSAGANVFGTSSTGLDRTRVYAVGAGEHGGLEGPAQYNVSYSSNHEATASTGFYYSGSAPQGPAPSDPDPVDPVDPPNVPEPPPLPPSQIIQTALDGNSFEQLNRPPQEDPTRFTPINLPVPQPPADLNSWTTGTTNQLETLAELAGIKGSKKQPDNSGVEQQQQPPQQVVDQLQDAVAHVMALFQEMQASGAVSSEQLAQQLGSLPQDLNLLLTQSPAVVLQQLAVILAQFSMEQQNAALAARTRVIAQISQTAQLSQTAEQMRNTAAEQLVNAITQMVNAALTVASDPKSKSPTPPKALTPTPQLSLPTDLVKNVPPPSPLPGGAFTGPPPTLSKTIGPVPPTLPPAVQAQLDAFRNSLHQGR